MAVIAAGTALLVVPLTRLAHTEPRRSRMMRVLVDEATLLDLLPEDHPSRERISTHIADRVEVYLERRVQVSDAWDDNADRIEKLERLEKPSWSVLLYAVGFLLGGAIGVLGAAGIVTDEDGGAFLLDDDIRSSYTFSIGLICLGTWIAWMWFRRWSRVRVQTMNGDQDVCLSRDE